ncbi:MAG TPA: hypothetical protein VF449_01620 [Parvibaculum sp.]
MRGTSSIKMAAAIGVAGIFLTASSAFAAGLKNEIAAAAQHAGLAAQGADIDTVHTHLHHTLNCLVGPDGKGFAPKEMNPCKELGKGAIPDATDAATKASLESEAAKAEAGIADTDLASAQKTAAGIQTALTAIK